MTPNQRRVETIHPGDWNPGDDNTDEPLPVLPTEHARLGRVWLRTTTDDRRYAAVLFPAAGPLRVWENGTTYTPDDAETLLLALGATPHWWWWTVQGIQRILDEHPTLSRATLADHLDRPVHDRDETVWDAFDTLGDDPDPLGRDRLGPVPDWVWCAAALDPDATVRRRFVTRLQHTTRHPEALVNAISARLDLDPFALFGLSDRKEWHNLPDPIRARVPHRPLTDVPCPACLTAPRS